MKEIRILGVSIEIRLIRLKGIRNVELFIGNNKAHQPKATRNISKVTQTSKSVLSGCYSKENTFKQDFRGRVEMGRTPHRRWKVCICAS